MTSPGNDDRLEGEQGTQTRRKQLGVGSGHPHAPDPSREAGVQPSLGSSPPPPPTVPGAGVAHEDTSVGDLADPENIWTLPRVVPTSIVGVLTRASKPDAAAIVAAFARYVGSTVAVVDDAVPVDASVAWTRVLAVPGLSAPVIVWTEPNRPTAVGELPDPTLADAEWVIGCQTLLGRHTPLDDFIALVRLVAGSLGDVQAIFDVTTRQWFLRGELEVAFLADEAMATEDTLWRVRAVSRSEVNGDDDPVWLYTVGLARCGCPELEILELPHKHLSTGVALLNGIAALALASPLPRPGVVAAIGENLRVAFRPWQEVAEFLSPSAVGTAADRRAASDRGEAQDASDETPNPLLGVRAAVCDPEPRGSFRRIWTWPRHAIRQLESDRGAIYLSDRSTLQLARRARATWPQFARAFEALRAELRAAQRGHADAPVASVPAFLVKAAFTRESEPDRGREHLWFEVRRFDGTSVEAELLNVPQVATHLTQGSVIRIRPEEVSDWCVLLDEESHRPTTVDALEAALRARAARSEA